MRCHGSALLSAARTSAIERSGGPVETSAGLLAAFPTLSVGCLNHSGQDLGVDVFVFGHPRQCIGLFVIGPLRIAFRLL